MTIRERKLLNKYKEILQYYINERNKHSDYDGRQMLNEINEYMSKCLN
jgi:hypothetical protein